MFDFKLSKQSRERVFDDLEQFIVQESNELAQDILEGVKRDTPVNTGRARRGWAIERATALEQQAQVGNDVEYVKYLEFGTANTEPLRFIQRNIKQSLNRRQ